MKIDTSQESNSPKNNIGNDLQMNDKEFLKKYKAFIDNVHFFYCFRYCVKFLDKSFNIVENIIKYKKINQPVRHPIFVTGNFRSGTSFLEKVISSHPSIGYFTYLSQIFPKSPIISNLGVRLLPFLDTPMIPLHQPNMTIRHDWPFEGEPIWRYCKNNCWTAEKTNILDKNFHDQTFEKIFKQTINKQLLSQKKERFINKNPWSTLRIGYLSKILPDSKFVHIVRHPYHILQSQIDNEAIFDRAFGKKIPSFNETFSDQFVPPRVLFRTKRYSEILELMKKNYIAGVALSIVDFDEEHERLVEESSLRNRIYRIKYEDLMANFIIEMKKIFEFLNLQDEKSENIIREQEIKFLDKKLISSKSALPQFSEQVQLILNPLIKKYNYSI